MYPQIRRRNKLTPGNVEQEFETEATKKNLQDELAAERKAAEGRLKKAEDELVAKNKAAEERLRQEEEDKLAAEKKANEDIGKLDLAQLHPGGLHMFHESYERCIYEREQKYA